MEIILGQQSNSFTSKYIKLLFILFCFFSPIFSENTDNVFSFIKFDLTPEDAIFCLKKAYPTKIIDSGLEDENYFIVIKYNNKQTKLYWANQSFLPKKELKNADKYEPLFHYQYPKDIPNPKLFSSEQIAILKKLGSNDNKRITQLKSITYFYNALYSGETKHTASQQIAKTKFLGKSINIHKDIKKPLANVEQKIIELSKTNSKVKTFIKEIHSIGGFNWREIRSSENRSSHSWGISIDIMPILRSKQIYWEWTKQYSGDKWITTPLSARWIPPAEVLEAFESEGFTWGGKWEIWDNMHFEYRPELLLFE